MNSNQFPGLEIRQGLRVRDGNQTTYLNYDDERGRDAAIERWTQRPQVIVEPCRIWRGTPLTGLVSFDRQTNYIGSGNVWATTQQSSYLRSTQEIECNGFTFGRKHLFQSDVRAMCSTRAGQDAFSYLRRLAEPNGGEFPGGWAYLFRYYDSACTAVLVGALVTDKHHHLLRRIAREDVGLRMSGKARHALDLLELIVTDRCEVH